MTTSQHAGSEPRGRSSAPQVPEPPPLLEVRGEVFGSKGTGSRTPDLDDMREA